MKFTSRFLQKVANIKIRLMRREEFEQVLDIAYKSFVGKINQSEEEFKNEIREELANRFRCCYVAEVDGRIVGGYLLSRQKNFRELDEIKEEMENKGIDLSGKEGVQGIALFVLPEFRGADVGRQLRDIPIKKMNVDFIWGEHYKSLDNIQNWLNAGRIILGEKDDYIITLREIPRGPKPTKPEVAPTKKEVSYFPPFKVGHPGCKCRANEIVDVIYK